MPNKKSIPLATNRILVKLRPSNALRAAESRVNLRPLYDTPQKAVAFGIGAQPQWFIADLSDAPANPWDLAHARVAEQLGVSETDVIFAEPDLIHNIYQDANEEAADQTFAAITESAPFEIVDFDSAEDPEWQMYHRRVAKLVGG